MTDPRFFPGLLLGAGLASAITLFGWLLASQVDPEGPILFRAALAFPLGAGLLTLCLFLLSLLGLPLSRGLILVVLAGAVAILGLRRLFQRSKSPPRQDSPPKGVGGHWTSVELPALVAICLLFAMSLALSIGRSYSTWDAASNWAVNGYSIARAGSVWGASNLGGYGFSYPLNIPLQVASFALLDGDIVPGSKLVFPLYYGSLALGLLAHFRHLRGRGAAWAVAFLIALPIVFDHASQGYANLPFATYVVLGCLLAVEGASSGHRGSEALSGMALGLAIWTRPEGLLLVAATYLALFAGARASGLHWKPGWGWFLPGFLIVGGWLAFGAARGESAPLPGLMTRIVASLSDGNPNLAGLYWIARYLAREALRPSVWGLMLAAVCIGGVLQWRRARRRRESRDFMVLAAAGATGAVVLAFYYAVSFDGNIEWWLDTGLSRMLLPSALLLTVWAVTPWLEPSSNP